MTPAPGRREETGPFPRPLLGLKAEAAVGTEPALVIKKPPGRQIALHSGLPGAELLAAPLSRCVPKLRTLKWFSAGAEAQPGL